MPDISNDLNDSSHQPKLTQSLNIRLLAPTYQCRYKTILDMIENSGIILDLGCADGFYSKSIASSVNKVFGVDVNTSFLDGTWQEDNPSFIAADATKLPFGDNNFDTVICVDMIEHTDEDEPILTEICRVLKSGGRLVISVPNHNFPITYDPLNFLLKPFHRHLPIGIWGFGHRRLYSPKKLWSELEHMGFEISEIRYLSHSFASFFENYLSTIFQGLANREKTRHDGNAPSHLIKHLYNIGYAITKKINSVDVKLLANSQTSVGFALSAIKK